MARDFTATVYAGDRREVFERVFGTATVPVMSPFPHLAGLPGFDEPQLIYELDLERVTMEQRGRLVAYLVEKFGVDEWEAEAGLESEGVPILASDCVASLGDVRKFL